MLIPLVLLACASIRGDFDAARAAALADPPPLADDWTPDLEIQLSAPVVADLLGAALAAQPRLVTTLEVGPARLTPRLHLDRAALVAERGNPDLLLDLELSGKVAWAVGPLEGSVPADASARVGAQVATVRDGDAWQPEVRVTSLRSVSVDLAGTVKGVSGIDGDLRTWLEEALIQLPALPLPPVGGADLPLRALQVRSAGTGLRLLGKTEANVDVGVERPGRLPATGFEAAIAEDALLALARTAAFTQGELAYGIVGDPTALDVTDDGFALGLRLWRPVGRGWWRDYQVTGTTTVGPRKVTLKATEAVEGEKSPGAVTADVLAALGEGLILRTVEEALAASVPATTEARIGDAVVDIVLEDLGPGQGRAVRIVGATTTH